MLKSLEFEESCFGFPARLVKDDVALMRKLSLKGTKPRFYIQKRRLAKEAPQFARSKLNSTKTPHLMQGEYPVEPHSL